MLSVLLGSDGGSWGHGWGTWPPGTWIRPADTMVGFSGKFWAATAYLRETLVGIEGQFDRYFSSSQVSDGGP